MRSRIDHLVVAASSLDQGVAWCEATLGVTPGPGGEHPLMGTHNRLLRVATVDHPRAYLEIIAVQPGRVPQRARRWFDFDDQQLRDTLARSGPRLVHFVASVPDLRQALAAWQPLDLDRGPPVAASRMTPRGLLEWQITVREDGQRLFEGTLPTLIEWGAAHPASGMPESGVTLQSLEIRHPQAAKLRAACEAIGLQGVAIKEGDANLCAVLDTPRGRARLDSGGV
jgi:hypothetical protein